jgi:3',5'-cyclic AMP phosphodiesterase CpdA
MAKIVSILLLCLFFTPYAEAFSVGIVADIHAGNKEIISKNRERGYFPAHYCQNLEGIKKSGVDYILTLGDNTLNGTKTEAFKILNCLEGHDVIWTKGNHDKEVAWQYFNTPNYYSKDFGKWKIIVLDSSKMDPGGSGGFYQEQLFWLKDQLYNSENVLIAMHHNMFRYRPLFRNPPGLENIFSVGKNPYWNPEIMEVYPQYRIFKNILEESGKVRYVYSGHVHGRNGCNKINGIEYCSVPALSLKDSEGYFAVLQLE